MKILYVTPRYAPFVGGTETHVREVARRAAAAGHDVAVLTTDPGTGLAPEDVVDGIRVTRVPAFPRGRDWYLAPALAGAIRASGADLVHVQNIHTAVAPLAMAAARSARIPYVVSFHSGGHSSRLRSALRAPQMLVLRPLLAGAARLVAVSPFEEARFRGLLRFGRGRFVVIPNGSDLVATAPANRVGDGEGDGDGEGAGVGDRAPLILSVGRLERYKGHQRVIAAFPGVLRRDPGARLRIAGFGPYEGELRTIAAASGAAERIEIAGVPPDDRGAMAALLERADVVTLLSDYEAHPLAAIEAGSLGRPLVVSSAGAFDSFVDDGLALRADADDPAAVADAVDACLRGRFRPAAAAAPWGWDDAAAALLDLYATVVRA